MLVLTRRAGQGISIAGGLIRVHVAEFRTHQGRVNTARIGIDAPDVLPVHRDEVLAEIMQAPDCQSLGVYAPGDVIPSLTERADTLAFRFKDADAALAALKSGVVIFSRGEA